MKLTSETLKEIINEVITELKFGSKAQYDAYKKKHKIKAGTTIDIDGKKSKEKGKGKISKAAAKKADKFAADQNAKLDAAEKAEKKKKKKKKIKEADNPMTKGAKEVIKTASDKKMLDALAHKLIALGVLGTTAVAASKWKMPQPGSPFYVDKTLLEPQSLPTSPEDYIVPTQYGQLPTSKVSRLVTPPQTEGKIKEADGHPQLLSKNNELEHN